MALGGVVSEHDTNRSRPVQPLAAPAAGVATQDLDQIDLVFAYEIVQRGRGLACRLPLNEAAVKRQPNAQLRSRMKRPSRVRNEVGTWETSGA